MTTDDQAYVTLLLTLLRELVEEKKLHQWPDSPV